MTYPNAPARPPRTTLVVTAHAGEFVWRAGRNLEEIKGIRREEAEKAAAVLGAGIRFFDAGDHPLVARNLAVRRGVQLKRNAGPDLGLAHRTTAEAYMRPFPQITKELA
ncbi:hypothetical protein ACQEV4_29270 [Streptomyces shenzhenensis]|uniref:hypothetical protein n=1 Tax=Streptomyces shenzhenensis TaxID=943815 RepID=UPI003D91F3CE